MDIADKSDSAILRPGKIPRWRVISSDFMPDSEIARVAKSNHLFGADIEAARTRSVDCCGALFSAELDGGIRARQFWQLEYFFVRDGAEALVFEFDRWTKQFFARRLAELWARRK